ncbi:hypothetical protein JDV02_004940 [Purpureocillium takamizusanense]|uniref:Protein kinase domain-containing protein n=1 Tax=Purpureocillium takamizusanense TaxID=2060973 RepID=A0A9Q8QGB2_9HYPO|nr:uncharacterized protein JDV02_004940 [Purpureocillium takamizusanense]UNI18686.1 hypothetical protein JDV02_004940 [Purpureocillium takamizusanense]
MSPARWAVGIDLGTANTRVAVYRAGRPTVEIVPAEDGSNFFPSYISISEDGRLIGAQAKRRALANLSGTFCHIKSLLGTRFSTPNLPPYAPILPFDILSGDGGPLASIRPRQLDARPIRSVELLSMLLGRAKSQAAAYLGEAVHEVSISVPALFNHELRREVSDAAEIAGLKVLSLTTEPCGLILAAMAGLQMPGVETNVLALDVGASYCNVAFATLEEGIVEIKAMSSDMVGGNDFNHVLFKHLLQLAEKKGLKPRRSKRAIHRLLMASEAAKIALSSSYKHTVELESLMNGQDFTETVTRETFESLCGHLFNQITATVDNMLVQSNYARLGVSYVFAGGESARIPKLQDLWKKNFTQSMIKYVNVGDAGAIGLALQAGVIIGMDVQTHPIQDLLLLEVATQHIGVETTGGTMTKLISRNGTVPSKYQESFWWNVKQECLEVIKPAPLSGEQARPVQAMPSHGALRVYEGNRTKTKDNRRIGTLDLMPLFAHVATANFVLQVEIDIDARHAISVKVSIPGTQAHISKSIDTAGALSDSEMQSLKVYAQKFAADDSAEAARVASRCDLDGHVAKCLELLDVTSADADPSLLDTVMAIRAWAEDNPDATHWSLVVKRHELEEIEAKIRPLGEAKTAQKSEKRGSGAPQERVVPDIGNPAVGGSTSRSVEANDARMTSRKASETHADGEQAPTVVKFHDADDAVRPSPVPRKKKVPKGVAEKGNSKPAAPEAVVVSGPNSLDPERETTSQRVGDAPWKNESLTVDSGVGGLEETVKKKPRAQSADESEAESGVPGNVDVSSTELTVVTSSSGLDAFFSSSTSMAVAFTDSDFYRMSTYLRNTGNAAWSTAPRLYTVLRVIDQLEAMETFLRLGINDMWFPFTTSTLPAALQPSIQARFLDRQNVAYSQSKSFQLENGEQKHAYFSKDDPLPFRVIARLGRGAHGSVDKVMSNFSQREYARKLFRKSRGLRAEDVQTFRTELGILKRLTHRHCVSLVATYSDPKYFALLMEPVGDHNLAEYYARCANEPDKRTLMRSFFGCLASAVQYLHDSKVRHRDIKPQNIIVRSDQVYLADFGIAHSWENLTRATTTADSGKTMIYAAPEVVRVERRNTAADMWSLGCVFLEMVTVLKRRTTQELRAYCMEQTDTPSFHANGESMLGWADELRQLVPLGDNAAVGWALEILQHDQHARPTAASLFEGITRESISCGTLFCGTCCDGVESTEGEEDDEHLWGDDGL